jgi:centromere/kinetochore protein ZW10
MLRLENDVKTLQSFANRAYSKEMSTQKVVLRDLLGGKRHQASHPLDCIVANSMISGEQNLMQQDETESCVDAAVARVRAMAITWDPIIARSVWCQAVGSLIDALSTKIITDVMDLPSIGQEEAYSIAKLIATVTELDDLFLPSRFQDQGFASEQAGDDEVPSTAQYASSWLRLKYLSEVLQSNLRDVRYLWMESELSLYFSVDEVKDLINLSFEDNPRTREVIKEISQNPHPRAD